MFEELTPDCDRLANRASVNDCNIEVGTEPLETLTIEFKTLLATAASRLLMFVVSVDCIAPIPRAAP